MTLRAASAAFTGFQPVQELSSSESSRRPSHVRADVIRQFHERGATDMVELLILCEEDDFKRAAMIEALQELEERL